MTVTRGRLQTLAHGESSYRLGIRAHHLISSMLEGYSAEPVEDGTPHHSAALK